jgi:hypothetical protein
MQSPNTLEIKPEAKPEIAHHDVPLGSAPEKERPAQDGDLGAQWIADYSGSRHDITSEESDRVRNKVGSAHRAYRLQQADKHRLTRSFCPCEITNLMPIHGTDHPQHLLHLLYAAARQVQSVVRLGVWPLCKCASRVSALGKPSAPC